MARTKEFDEASVLEKAVQLFWCKGYNGASAQDIVDELGISRSSLYDTFGDKRSLFLRSLKTYRDKTSTDLITMINESNNILQTVRQILHHVAKDSSQDKAVKGCFMVNSAVELAPHDKDVAKIVDQNMKSIESALSKALKKGQDQGIISDKHAPTTMARFIFNCISGLRVAAKSGATKAVYDDVIEMTIAALEK
jgi:TetR/AcrR family transcriptional regulator, transcriptional repressor for nem operon